MSNRSTSVAQAIDRVRESLGSLGAIGNYHYQAIANGPVEQVLAFNNDETIQLIPEKGNVHFSSHGVLTDLQRNEIPGSAVETTFPVDPTKFDETEKWPPEQKEPWDEPPLDSKHTENGYSKQAYFFNKKRTDYLVTVGPSVPKITRLKDGGAQFWVASIGAITQGSGKYEGAHGMSVYIGSAYLSNWPKAQPDQIKLLTVPFHARIGTYFKFVLP